MFIGAPQVSPKVISVVQTVSTTSPLEAAKPESSPIGTKSGSSRPRNIPIDSPHWQGTIVSPPYARRMLPYAQIWTRFTWWQLCTRISEPYKLPTVPSPAPPGLAIHP